MIDQRVSEGINSNFFGKSSLTTTIPAQMVKRFNCQIVPIYIERYKKYNFKMTVSEPIKFNEKENIKNITSKLNRLIEKMILKNPDQWIWSHNRWK
jgi:KDO2-lipid IV(A) lauroyltransferase